VIEEYTRPARLVENGRMVVKEPLSNLELLNFEGVGTLEAFNTDGLRTLLTTIPARQMREKTLRYPGHASRIQFLKDLGLFSSQTVETSTGKVVPRDLAATLLFEQWRCREGEADLTVMRVEVSGERAGQHVRYRYDLLDRYDPASGLSSMARTTGFMATAVARQLLAGRIKRKGVFAPEALGAEPELFHTIMSELAERGVVYRRTTPPEEGSRPSQ
ncbi:MAG: saccharopine dehydrogenase, partial [Calditrichaeota bacterium]|nr:saccharopine dehydrogenase [Calditrichota bacterium]